MDRLPMPGERASPTPGVYPCLPRGLLAVCVPPIPASAETSGCRWFRPEQVTLLREFLVEDQGLHRFGPEGPRLVDGRLAPDGKLFQFVHGTTLPARGEPGWVHGI